MASSRLGRRLLSAAMTGATYGAAALAVLPLAAILGMLVMKGAGSLDWNFFTRSSVPLGESGGGFAYAIVGTLIIVGLACAIGIPVGVPQFRRAIPTAPTHTVKLRSGPLDQTLIRSTRSSRKAGAQDGSSGPIAIRAPPPTLQRNEWYQVWPSTLSRSADNRIPPSPPATKGPVPARKTGASG